MSLRLSYWNLPYLTHIQANWVDILTLSRVESRDTDFCRVARNLNQQGNRVKIALTWRWFVVNENQANNIGAIHSMRRIAPQGVCGQQHCTVRAHHSQYQQWCYASLSAAMNKIYYDGQDAPTVTYTQQLLNLVHFSSPGQFPPTRMDCRRCQPRWHVALNLQPA